MGCRRSMPAIEEATRRRAAPFRLSWRPQDGRHFRKSRQLNSAYAVGLTSVRFRELRCPGATLRAAGADHRSWHAHLADQKRWRGRGGADRRYWVFRQDIAGMVTARGIIAADDPSAGWAWKYR